MKAGQFVEDDFEIPETLETHELMLRMLTIHDVEKDFDAVTSSASVLNEMNPNSNWPEGLTVEQNLIDLGWNQKEFQSRRSFTYTVVTLDESKVLGCVYIYPTRKRGYDAEVYLWARETKMGTGLDVDLFNVIKDWMGREWPFENAAYPGREIDWEKWDDLADEKR